MTRPVHHWLAIKTEPYRKQTQGNSWPITEHEHHWCSNKHKCMMIQEIWEATQSTHFQDLKSYVIGECKTITRWSSNTIGILSVTARGNSLMSFSGSLHNANCEWEDIALLPLVTMVLRSEDGMSTGVTIMVLRLPSNCKCHWHWNPEMLHWILMLLFWP